MSKNNNKITRCAYTHIQNSKKFILVDVEAVTGLSLALQVSQ